MGGCIKNPKKRDKSISWLNGKESSKHRLAPSSCYISGLSVTLDQLRTAPLRSMHSRTLRIKLSAHTSRNKQFKIKFRRVGLDTMHFLIFINRPVGSITHLCNWKKWRKIHWLEISHDVWESCNCKQLNWPENLLQMQTSQNRRESMPNIPEPSDFLNSCPSYILRNPWFIFDIIISFTRLGYGLRDGSGVGYQYECWKSSKRGGGHFQSKSLYCRCWTFELVFQQVSFWKKIPI